MAGAGKPEVREHARKEAQMGKPRGKESKRPEKQLTQRSRW